MKNAILAFFNRLLDGLIALGVFVAIIVVLRFAWKKGKRFYNEFTHEKRMTELARAIREAADLAEKAQAYAHRASYWHCERKLHFHDGEPDRDACDRAAVTDYTKAIELTPSTPWLYQLRARHYGERRDWDAALADYTAFLEIRGDFTVYLHRARIYLRRKEYSRVVEDCTAGLAEDIPSAHHRSQLLQTRGDAYQAMGMLSEAADDHALAKEYRNQ